MLADFEVVKSCWAMVSSKETEIGIPLCSLLPGLIITRVEGKIGAKVVILGGSSG